MPCVIHWFRRDLRFDDNRALDAALSSGHPVVPVFIFDTDILDRLVSPRDARVAFIHAAVASLKAEAQAKGSDVLVRTGRPEEEIPRLAAELGAAAVYAGEDHEPSARRRDRGVDGRLSRRGVALHLIKDQLIFGPNEVLKDDGKPYTVYTPYARKYFARLREEDMAPCRSGKKLERLSPIPTARRSPLPNLGELGFETPATLAPKADLSPSLLSRYEARRDIPSIAGTSRLGVHLRFGTLSVREAMRKSFPISPVFAKELAWREFFSQILSHFPHVAERSFREEGERVPWREDPGGFRAWCEGRTGYPMVDAGMRELVATGHMHNRVRMVTASFLTKHLLIHWRRGEAFFARHLLDYDLASNNGNWQWAAGTGCDAAPYFRVFSPSAQAKRFDAGGAYVKRWVPEVGTPAYPPPLVEHEAARKRVLKAWAEAKARGQ